MNDLSKFTDDQLSEALAKRRRGQQRSLLLAEKCRRIAGKVGDEALSCVANGRVDLAGYWAKAAANWAGLHLKHLKAAAPKKRDGSDRLVADLKKEDPDFWKATRPARRGRS